MVIAKAPKLLFHKLFLNLSLRHSKDEQEERTKKVEDEKEQKENVKVCAKLNVCVFLGPREVKSGL